MTAPEADADGIRADLDELAKVLVERSIRFGQFTLAWTLRILRQQAHIPAPLWLIQPTEKQVHLMVMLLDFRIAICFADSTFTLTDLPCHCHSTQPPLIRLQLYH